MRKLLLSLIILLTYSVSTFGQCISSVDFGYSYTSCNVIQFADSSKTVSPNYRIVSQQWDFGDGSTGTGSTIPHTFSPGANVQVKLVVTAADTLGNICKDSITKNITVRTLPIVNIASNPNPSCLDYAPQFYGSSNHPIKSWQWIFGDGDTVNVQNPAHLYADTGWYNVQLYVLDSSGCANDTLYRQRIDPIPTVGFTWNPDPATTADNIQFTGSSNASATATSIGWHWDFGDGDTANVQNPTHNYPAAGNYNVSLSVLVNGICTNTITKSITINPIPVAKFGYSYLSCNQIHFSDSSYASPNYTIVKWHWNFGDGTTSTSQNDDHTFTPGASVRVSLLVTAEDTLGNQYVDSTFKDITVHSLPTVHVTSTPNPACLQLSPQFTGTSNHPIQSWQWIFGDGDTVNTATPIHHYADTGSYNVILHVVDTFGCENQNNPPYVQRINPDPNVDFTWSPDPATTIDNIQFNGTSTDAAGATSVAWHWDFGDGDTANVQNPTHRFSVAGQDTVTLTVTINGTCTSSISKVVTVSPYVIPNFTTSVSCLHDMTYFTDSSVVEPGTSIQTWIWIFGDGDTTFVNSPASPNVTHVYGTQNTYRVKLVTVTTSGYERSVTKDVTVVPKPTANFNYQVGCYRTPTTFTDRSLTNGGSALTSWHWTLGDGNTSNAQDTTHIYAYPGSYNVNLYIQNADGCRDTVQRTVVIDTLPTVDFTMSNDTICQNGTIQFTGQSSTAATWDWDFGNGNTSNYRVTSSQYTVPGLDTVTLTVADVHGCTSATSKTVYVRPGPVANFDFNILCNADTTCFWDTSTVPSGYISSWNWDFGDSITDTIQNPQHYYVPDTNYNATLTVTSNEGCSNSITQLIIFDSLPYANFGVSNACMDDVTHFTDSTFTPGTSQIITRKWYFGDGDSLIVNNTNPTTADHIYRYTTSYNVTLITINSFGKSDTVTKQINVDHKPLAAFTFNDTCFTKPTTFTDLSQSDGGSALVAWNWNFGDPLSGIHNTDTLQNPTHVMSYPGSYDVRMIVTNATGCSDTANRTVVIDSLPAVAFTVNKDSMCYGEIVRFTGTGSNIVSWHWDFGNGDTSSYQNPVYQYPQPGTYVVVLTVKNLNGCTNFAVDTLFVDHKPTAAFTVGASCLGDSTYFYSNSTSSNGYISQWDWNFGEASSANNLSSVENPVHLYTTTGTYSTQLVVTDNYGCTDTVSHFVNIYGHPKAAFTYRQSCDPHTQVNFTDQSAQGINKSPISSYLWKFYQDDTSHLQNPNYDFPFYDSCYQVILTVADTNGCTDADTAQVCLTDTLSVDFTMPRVCLGSRTAFSASYGPSNDSIAAYTWNFSDGSAEVVTYHDTISHVFPHPGTYNVVLSAIDTNGCSVSVTHKAVVDSLPKADFTYSTQSCDLATQFQGVMSSGGAFIQTWNWNFGDVSSGADNTSTIQNPSHLYSSNDSAYQVKLVVMNYNGCKDSITKPVVRSSCLEVSYTVNTSTGCAENPVYFKDYTSLGSSSGSIDQWDWNFGDGQTLTYTTYRDSVLHVYNVAGSYTVTLTVTATVNGIPFSNSYDSTIQIYRPPLANFGFTNACTNKDVYFTDSTQTYDAPLNQWQWSFNDPYSLDNTSALQNPVHRYDSTGTFDAQLVVIDNNNCRDTVTKSVTVHITPEAAFNATFNNNGNTGQVYLENTSTNASTYLWNFGDGHSSTEESPTYTYSSVGIFTILLTATSDYLCVDTASTVYDLTSGLYVPNSFAPGVDKEGVNVFLPKGINLKEYEIQIFSSWGNLLWESTELNAEGEPVEGWDGTYKGQPMPAGEYIWRIKAKFLDGRIWQGSDNGDGNMKPYGTLLLIR
ncbi:MAG: PKD domain-containing protein [Bacteroidales bacterium]|nr:PKD domain-containing protein [Bacteroidales bacterium]